MPKPIKFQKLVKTCLEMNNHIKLFHWLSEKYGNHLALDELYSTLDEKIDKLIEVYLGATKMHIKKFDTTIKLDVDISKLQKSLSRFVHELLILRKSFNSMPSIQTIVDDMVIAVNQAQYLTVMK